MCPDILIINGHCMTMKNRETFDWIAIKNDEIISLGKEKEY